MTQATDPASMIALIDGAIAQIVAGTLGQSQINGRTFTLLNLSQLRDLRQYYVALNNQLSPAGAMLSDVSSYPRDRDTTNSQPYGPRQ